MKIKTIDMSVSDFIKIPSNPIQRNVELHGKKASKFHLSSRAVTHAKVSIAVCKNKRWKLDGHTRSYLWSHSTLEAPKMLSVDIYFVKGIDDAIELYSHFDNSKAAETIPDRLSGALHYMKINNYNKFVLQGAGIVNALRCINSATNHYIPYENILKLLLPWYKELKIFAGMHWVSNSSHGKPGVPAAVTLAFFVTVKMYDNDSLGFWDAYYNNTADNSLKSGRSGSQAAIDWIISQRKKELIAGQQNTLRNAEALIRAYHYYRAKKPVTKLTALYKRETNKSFLMQFGEFIKNIGFPTLSINKND